MEWTPAEYRDMLQHPKAERQFHNDIEAMEACDMRVLVLPCGRSAHTKPEMVVRRGLWNHGYTMGRTFEVVELSSICGEQKNR